MATDKTEAFADELLIGDWEKAKEIHAEGGVDMRHTDDETGFGFLHTAVRMGKVDAVEWLLDRGVPVDMAVAEIDSDDDWDKEQEGATALMLVADSIAGKQREIIDVLLAAGADVNAVDAVGRNVLHYALEAPKFLDFFLKKGADPNARTADGETALMRATLMGADDAVELLRGAGATEEGMLDVDLGKAAYAGDRDRVVELLEQGANVNFCDNGTAFGAAASNGNLEIMQLLIDAGADIDRYETDYPEGDFNPLLRAAYDADVDVVRFLLDAGADLTVANHGTSPLDYAKLGKAEGHNKDRPWDEVIEMLRNAASAAAPTLRGKRVDSGVAAAAAIEALQDSLPGGVEWTAYAAGDIELYESTRIDDVDYLRSELPALQRIAREHGFSLSTVAWSLDDAEPRLADLEKERRKVAKTSGTTLFDTWEAERLKQESGTQDDDEDDYSWSTRQRVLAELTAAPDRKDRALGVDAGHLVLCAGGSATIPIAYRFGGWNSAPLPHEMGIALDHWHDAYGAELVSIGRSTLAVRLPEPLATLEQVRAAAREIGLFCDESDSAATDLEIAVGDCWSFWWD